MPHSRAMVGLAGGISVVGIVNLSGRGMLVVSVARQLGSRGHAHAVLVCEDGFEYEGQRYRSLTMIAARITGAHWSGPRFFGVTKRTPRSMSIAAGSGDE